MALSALTTFPAEAMGVEKTMGKIQPGYIANLVITDGDYFNTKSRVTSLWINGEEIFVADRHKVSVEGDWELEISGKSYDLAFQTSQSKKGDNTIKVAPIGKGKLIGIIKNKDLDINLSEIEIYNTTVEFKADGSFLSKEGFLAFKGVLSNDRLVGNFFDGGLSATV